MTARGQKLWRQVRKSRKHMEVQCRHAIGHKFAEEKGATQSAVPAKGDHSITLPRSRQNATK